MVVTILVLISFSEYTPSSGFLTIVLIACLILVFCSNYMVVFYAFFEIRLIPIILIIFGRGYQPERRTASFYMVRYTILCSLPLLFFILLLRNNFARVSFLEIRALAYRGDSSFLKSLYVGFIILGFLVKFPMYGVHLWLPKAHVEAPVEGSMILAALLLKLGAFGLIQFTPLIPAGVLAIAISSFRGVGGVLIGILALRQTDIKVLIAYSSVAHISVAIICALSQTRIGLFATLIVLVAHGFSSPGLFLGANILYLRSRSRNILITFSIGTYIQILILFWFCLVAANMSAPPSLNLLGELGGVIALFAINS